jgi:K+-sensing histidine kinase KdpD
LLAVVGHALRTPLAALLVAADDLSDGVDLHNANRSRQLVGQIRSGTAWLQCQVDNLLTVELLRSRQLQIQPRLTDLVAWVCELQEVVHALLVHKNQVLRLARRGAMPAVLMDPRRVTQAVVNLIANASRVMEADQVIDVTLARHGRLVRITVADRGPGLRGESPEQLFAMTDQATATGQPDEGMTGLGLGVTRMIIEAHGGQVGAHTRRRGGACFWVELPVGATATPAELVK